MHAVRKRSSLSDFRLNQTIRRRSLQCSLIRTWRSASREISPPSNSVVPEPHPSHFYRVINIPAVKHNVAPHGLFQPLQVEVLEFIPLSDYQNSIRILRGIQSGFTKLNVRIELS